MNIRFVNLDDESLKLSTYFNDVPMFKERVCSFLEDRETLLRKKDKAITKYIEKIGETKKEIIKYFSYLSNYIDFKFDFKFDFRIISLIKVLEEFFLSINTGYINNFYSGRYILTICNIDFNNL